MYDLLAFDSPRDEHDRQRRSIGIAMLFVYPMNGDECKWYRWKRMVPVGLLDVVDQVGERFASSSFEVVFVFPVCLCRLKEEDDVVEMICLWVSIGIITLFDYCRYHFLGAT